MNSPNQSHSTDPKATLGAIAGISVLLARLGGAVIGIAAISYIIGRNYLWSYHSQVGTSWVLALYSSDQVAGAGVLIASIIAMVAFFALLVCRMTLPVSRVSENG